jgi:putative hemolysin
MEHEITSEDFETLNGLIVSALGHIPSEGEQFSMIYQGCQIDIVEVKNKMITLARVTVLPEEEPSEEEEE